MKKRGITKSDIIVTTTITAWGCMILLIFELWVYPIIFVEPNAFAVLFIFMFFSGATLLVVLNIITKHYNTKKRVK